MTIHLRSFLLGSCALLVGCADQQGQVPDDSATAKAVQPLSAAVQLGAIPLARDARGVPHLMRGGDAMPKLPAATATESARQHLERLSPAWGLRGATTMPVLEALGEVPVSGGTIVRFRQVIAGLPVEPTAGGEMRVMVTADGGLVGVSGTLVPTDTAHAAAPKFVDDDAGAIARAVNDKYKIHEVTSRMLASARTTGDGARLLAGAAPGVTVSMSRARQAWFPSGNALVASWVVEAYSSANGSATADAYRTVISSSGKVLARTNLRADAAPVPVSYRVFAENTGEFHPFDGPIPDPSPNPVGFTFVPFPNTPPPPDFLPIGSENLISLVGNNHPAGGAPPDPWLPAGQNSTLGGNNVHTYTDANPPDGLSAGDFGADMNSANTFDRTYDLTAGPLSSNNQTQAGITSLFYLLNWMHDFWYDGGFTEAAGNGQDNNYGRGGVDHDAMLGEAQDNALAPVPSKDNANMATPSDGMPGKMQIFVWDNLDGRKLTINPAAPTDKGLETNGAQFSPPKFSLTAALIVANDGVSGTTNKDGETGTLSDNCEPPAVDAYKDKIVIIDRGFCSFQQKAANAIIGTAAGMIVADNNPNDVHPFSLGNDDTLNKPTPIATLSVTKADGATLKAAAAATKQVTMSRDQAPDLDGTLDITVVGHEFGHFVHHRLTSCETKLCAAMSEGWADFSALLVSSRAGDFATPNQQFPLAVYSTRGISLESQYFGVRRAPYSTDHVVNPLSFRHMADGEPLPPAPFNGGDVDPGNNSEVHNAGEVWASMLWEGYVALQRLPGADFEATRLKMRQYEVAGLMLAPPDATPTETRDALLTAVKAKSPDDYAVLLQAYANRGFGSCAVSPDRNSQDFNPIIESSEIKGRPDFGNISAVGSQACDNDAFLDPGEQFEISVPITNGGAVKMTGVTATLHSALVEFDDPTKATVKLGDLDIGAKATATFTVTLAATVTVPTESDITIEVASADGCQVAAVPLVTRFNSDDKPNSSASDDFNSEATAWTASSDGLWLHARDSGLDGFLIGNASASASDTTMTSPPITAGAAPITLSFVTAWDFETTAAGGAVDGGVIEYSTDAGVTWSDISKIAAASPYNTTLVDDSDNVLHGRPAFGAAHDNGVAITIDLGTKLADQTFQIRFRIGTDTGTGGGGWIIDNLAFTGITNTPFTSLVADGDHCAPAPGTNNHDDGGCCQAGGMTTGNLAAALGVLGLVLRRRRRAAR
jgi:hypothetical protein